MRNQKYMSVRRMWERHAAKKTTKPEVVLRAGYPPDGPHWYVNDVPMHSTAQAFEHLAACMESVEEADKAARTGRAA